MKRSTRSTWIFSSLLISTSCCSRNASRKPHNASQKQKGRLKSSNKRYSRVIHLKINKPETFHARLQQETSFWTKLNFHFSFKNTKGLISRRKKTLFASFQHQTNLVLVRKFNYTLLFMKFYVYGSRLNNNSLVLTEYITRIKKIW